MGSYPSEQIEAYSLAIINRDRYEEDPICPHCEINVRPEDEKVLRYVETIQLIGHVQKCAECHEPILILDEPKMEHSDTYFLRVKLK